METLPNKSSLRGTQSSWRFKINPINLPAIESLNISESKQNFIERGMAIERIKDTLLTEYSLCKSNWSYSNTIIENHFLKLREENKIKLLNDNQKMWRNMIHVYSYKKNNS